MEDDLNQKLDVQWNTHFSGMPDVLHPYYFDWFKRSTLLFVGFNPSFNEEKMRKRLIGVGVPEGSAKQYFAWVNRDSFDRQLAIKLGRTSRATQKFYGPHRDISQKLGGVSWEHLDLFRFFRTSQEEMRGLLSARPTFEQDQLALFDEALKWASPRVILVANAEASAKIKRIYDPKFDGTCGWHFIDLNCSSVPIFFSSMITGQRALDVHSRERLEWHIQQAWNLTTIS